MLCSNIFLMKRVWSVHPTDPEEHSRISLTYKVPAVCLCWEHTSPRQENTFSYVWPKLWFWPCGQERKKKKKQSTGIWHPRNKGQSGSGNWSPLSVFQMWDLAEAGKIYRLCLSLPWSEAYNLCSVFWTISFPCKWTCVSHSSLWSWSTSKNFVWCLLPKPPASAISITKVSTWKPFYGLTFTCL